MQSACQIVAKIGVRDTVAANIARVDIRAHISRHIGQQFPYQSALLTEPFACRVGTKIKLAATERIEREPSRQLNLPSQCREL